MVLTLLGLWIVVLAVGVVAVGFAQPRKPVSEAGGGDPPGSLEETPLIPRTVLYGNPERAMARLSPDGKRLAFLAPLDGVLNVWVGPVTDPGAAHAVTRDTNRGIRQYFWAYTNRHIIYPQDVGGDENWHVHSVDLETNETRDLTPLEKVAARVENVSERIPDEILVLLNDRDEQLHDVYRIHLTSGERTLVLENEGFVSFVTDDDYKVRFASRMTESGGGDYFRRTESGSWEPFAQIDATDVLTTDILRFDKAGEKIYMLDSRERDTAALTLLDLETGDVELLAEDRRADISRIMSHPTEKHVQAAASNFERVTWNVLDEAIASDFDFLKDLSGGQVEVVSRTLDDQRWVVAYHRDDDPVRYYVYDRERRQAEFLFTGKPVLEGLPLAKMHPTVIKSRDGLNLVSYLTLPVWSDPDGDGRPVRPLPLVLDVHGGPWARDEWGYDSTHQWLANRGYAALSVNFRGSTGFGKDFINKANLEWAGTMHNDLLDAVDWAVAENIADADRVAIMGGSYGGYATLVGLTSTPDRFACGVDIVGPSNLITLLETIPPYWLPMIEMMTTRVGDHRTEVGQALLKERSPLTHVERIKKPLLIGQGANDPRVKQSESDQIVTAMKSKGIPVTYVLYEDEGHGFARPENRMSFSSTIAFTWSPRPRAAHPRCTSSTCPMFMREGTPSGLSTMSTGEPSAR